MKKVDEEFKKASKRMLPQD